VPQSYYFCIKNALKLTYDHLYFKKKFLGSLSLAMKQRDIKGRKGRGGDGKQRRKKGKGERSRGYSTPKLGTLSTPLHPPSEKRVLPNKFLTAAAKQLPLPEKF
jgi:hypothetical protein